MIGGGVQESAQGYGRELVDVLGNDAPEFWAIMRPVAPAAEYLPLSAPEAPAAEYLCTGDSNWQTIRQCSSIHLPAAASR